MNQSLYDLYRSGTITYEDAIEHCHDQADFERLMQRGAPGAARSGSTARRPLSR
jgi:Tfp pilus assembly ATPase PilU